MSRREISRYPSRKPVLDAPAPRLPDAWRRTAGIRRRTHRCPRTGRPTGTLPSRGWQGRSPVVDEAAPGARGAVAEHGPRAPSGALRSSWRIAHSSTGCGSPHRVESSAKPVDPGGRQVARRRFQKAEARLRRGDSVQLCELPAQLRCELGVLHPATIDGRTRAAFLVSLRLQTRIQRHRLYCCALSIPTSVTNPVRVFLLATATVRNIRHRPGSFARAASRSPSP